MVSVDTNTINWVRAGAYNLSSKCSYIPNFVDCDQFKPEITRKSENRLVILYPRRLYEARGFWLVEKIIPGLLEKYPCLEFHFCGKANRLEEVEVKALINNYPENVKWYFYPPEEMHQAYPKADIVVIPTLYSEGTSLSCLEALACRKAVIATNVGGLPNLIIPDFNGLLIEPDVDSLREALELLINNEELRNKIAENGYKTASAFNIKTWGLRWRNLFKNYLPGLPPRN